MILQIKTCAGVAEKEKRLLQKFVAKNHYAPLSSISLVRFGACSTKLRFACFILYWLFS